MLGRKQTNILVIKTDSLAGFVAAEPAFEAIREAHDGARISLLTASGLQRIARAAPYFDQVAAMPDFRDAEARKAFVRQLKSARFEKVYDLAGGEAGRRLRAALGPFGPKWFAAEPASRKSGPKKTGRQKPAAVLPQVGKMMAAAGLDAPARLPDLRWAMSARKDSANMQPSWYGISGAFGLLLPGADPERRWTASGYAGLAAVMAREGVMPVLAGPKELHQFGDEIAHETPQLVDLTGKTDHLQLAALAHEAAFFVSDHAEETQLALSVGCEGVLIVRGKDPRPEAPGRHVVPLTASGALDAVEPDFVWRTLSNMGLIGVEDAPLKMAGAR